MSELWLLRLVRSRCREPTGDAEISEAKDLRRNVLRHGVGRSAPGAQTAHDQGAHPRTRGPTMAQRP